MWAGRFLVFVVILVTGAFLGWGISKIVHLAGLSNTDRALGGLFGLMRAALLVGVFVLGGRYAGFDANLWWLESNIIPVGEYLADWIIEMAPRGMEMLQPENLPDEFQLELPDLD
jgi:membrane protein required for colicin V production